MYLTSLSSFLRAIYFLLAESERDFFVCLSEMLRQKKCVGCIAGVFIEMFARVVMEKDGTRADPAWLFKTIQRTREGDPALRNH